MGLAPSKTAQNIWVTDTGQDFLQMMLQGAGPESWIDSDGVAQGNLFQNSSLNLINVKKYGATGNGTTDDTAAINLAIAAIPSSGGVLYFPQGTYVISSALTIAKANTTILGDSINLSVIYLKSASNSNMLNITASSVTVQNILFNGNSAGQTTGTKDGISVSTTLSNITLRSMGVINCFYYGVLMLSTSNVLVDSCVFSGSLNCQFVYNMTASIASAGIIIINNFFDSTGQVLGAAVTNPFVCLYLGESVGSGATVSNVVISDNIIYFPVTGNTEADGLVIDSSTSPAAVSFTNVTITNNIIACPSGTFTAGAANSVELVGVSDSVVSGNILTGAHVGIIVGTLQAAGASNLSIVNNTCISSGVSGATLTAIVVQGVSGTVLNVTTSDNNISGFRSGISYNGVLMSSIVGNTISTPNLSSCAGITLTGCEAVNVDSNSIQNNNSGTYAITQNGATEKYESYRGNVIKGSGYGFAFNATAYTACVCQGNIFDGLNAGNAYVDLVPTGILLIDDSGKTITLPTPGTMTVSGSITINGTSGIAVPAGISGTQIATPTACTVTQAGTPGSTNYSYTLTAVDQFGFETLAPTATQTTLGAATLNSTNYNIIHSSAFPAGCVKYNVYRTASSGTPSTTGIIGTITTSAGVLNDKALAGDGSSIPSWNFTGLVVPAPGLNNTSYSGYVLTPTPESGYNAGESASVLCGNSTANVMQVAMMYCTRTITVNRVSFDITTNVAATTGNIAIYRGDGGKKLFDVNFSTASSGLVTATTTGVSGFAFPFTFYAGQTYYIATSSSNNTIAVAGITVNSTLLGTSLFNAVNIRTGYSANSVAAGVSPATLGSLTSSIANLPAAMWEP